MTAPPRPARLVALVALALALALAACGAEEREPAAPAGGVGAPGADGGGVAERPAGPRTLLDVVAETPELSTLAALVEGAGLGSVLADTSQTVTLFAPSDAAFAALPAAALDALRSDPAALRRVLLAHAVPTRLPAADVFAEITFGSLAGSDLTVDADEGGVTARGPAGMGRVLTPDLDAANGVVHVVDAVLALPDAT